jgi:hypothetical protein
MGLLTLFFYGKTMENPNGNHGFEQCFCTKGYNMGGSFKKNLKLSNPMKEGFSTEHPYFDLQKCVMNP